MSVARERTLSAIRERWFPRLPSRRGELLSRAYDVRPVGMIGQACISPSPSSAPWGGLSFRRRWMRALLAAVLLLPPISSCGDTTTDPVMRYSLRRQVTVVGRGGLEGVAVTLPRPALDSTVTDSDGRFSFTELESGSYPVAMADFPYVFVTDNSIQDVKALEDLTALEGLLLSGNDVRDVSPLGGLVALATLDLASNSVVDIAPLAGLTAMRTLSLADKDIGDPSALGTLLNLSILDLSGNAITTVDPLRDLTKLRQLHLDGNQGLVDIRALPENTGLGSDDQVSLEGTGVDCADVAALEAKGVAVTSDCSE